MLVTGPVGPPGASTTACIKLAVTLFFCFSVVHLKEENITFGLPIQCKFVEPDVLSIQTPSNLLSDV